MVNFNILLFHFLRSFRYSFRLSDPSRVLNEYKFYLRNENEKGENGRKRLCIRIFYDEIPSKFARFAPFPLPNSHCPSSFFAYSFVAFFSSIQTFFRCCFGNEQMDLRVAIHK